MAQLCVGRLARKPLGVHGEEFVLVVAGGCKNPHGSTRFPTSGLTQNIVLVFERSLKCEGLIIFLFSLGTRIQFPEPHPDCK